jgi:hypothetical protein
MNWLWKFVSRPLRKQAVRPLRNLRGERCESKQWILTPPEKRLEQRRENERLEREEARLERRKWAKFPPDPEPIEGRTCAACGGTLVLMILNYHMEGGTDFVTPADKAEKCILCRKPNYD